MRHRRIRSSILLPLLLVLGSSACAESADPGAATLTDVGVRDVTAAPAPVRVMTRNLYLGADIDQVLFGGPDGVARALEEVQRTSFPHRAHALAAEIVGRGPHVVGLQEVSTFILPTAAGPFEIDFLSLLRDALQARGADYDVAVRATNFTTLLPVAPGVAVFYADGDAILVRRGVTVHESDWSHFAPENQVDLGQYIPGLGLNLRGYQWADVAVEGQRFLFVNTHLEVQFWADVQERQAAELLAFLQGRPGPVVVVGDFNSAANPDAPAGAVTATYGMIREAGYDDLWIRAHGAFTTEGLTCCHASNLSNEAPELDQRIDFLFARNVPAGPGGYAGGARLDVFGDATADRFSTGLGYDLWPSDHAGLFGELRLPPGLTP